MAADSSEVDAAVVAKLINDSTLMALLTDGVFVDVAASGKTKFCIVSQVAHEDAHQFSARAYEQFLYLVKAVVLNSSGVDAKTAAARIDTLLEGVSLTITGYTHMLTRREERVRYTEVDPENPDTRWNHRGGRYAVFASPTS